LSLRYLLLIILIGINIYFLIYGGVYSKRKYSYLGGIRSRAARVRYEVIFSLSLINFILYNKSYYIEGVFNWGLLILYLVFFISVLVEISRAPFDYSERESELVRGFNTEYRRVGFVLFFLKEYGSLLFFSLITSYLFFIGRFFFRVVIFVSIVVVRSRFPRVRYDYLMGLFWLQLIFFVCRVLWASFTFLSFCWSSLN